MFGENCDLIHSVVFDPKQARTRFKDPSQFSERSIVQLKKKFKKDAQHIDELIANREAHQSVAWFEKKYGINV